MKNLVLYIICFVSGIGFYGLVAKDSSKLEGKPVEVQKNKVEKAKVEKEIGVFYLGGAFAFTEVTYKGHNYFIRSNAGLVHSFSCPCLSTNVLKE